MVRFLEQLIYVNIYYKIIRATVTGLRSWKVGIQVTETGDISGSPHSPHRTSWDMIRDSCRSTWWLSLKLKNPGRQVGLHVEYRWCGSPYNGTTSPRKANGSRKFDCAGFEIHPQSDAVCKLTCIFFGMFEESKNPWKSFDMCHVEEIPLVDSSFCPGGRSTDYLAAWRLHRWAMMKRFEVWYFPDAPFSSTETTWLIWIGVMICHDDWLVGPLWFIITHAIWMRLKQLTSHQKVEILTRLPLFGNILVWSPQWLRFYVISDPCSRPTDCPLHPSPWCSWTSG